MAEQADETPQQRFERWRASLGMVQQGYERLDWKLTLQVAADTAELWQMTREADQQLQECKDAQTTALRAAPTQPAATDDGSIGDPGVVADVGFGYVITEDGRWNEEGRRNNHE